MHYTYAPFDHILEFDLVGLLAGDYLPKRVQLIHAQVADERDQTRLEEEPLGLDLLEHVGAERILLEGAIERMGGHLEVLGDVLHVLAEAERLAELGLDVLLRLAYVVDVLAEDLLGVLLHLVGERHDLAAYLQLVHCLFQTAHQLHINGAHFHHSRSLLILLIAKSFSSKLNSKI